jgi:hypothetical protein
MTLEYLGQQNEKLPLMMRMRKIILILKPTKEPDDENTYRPISLLEIPYKIIDGVIANRLKNVSDLLIGPSQKGYMPGRCSSDITRSVQDIRDYANIKNKSLVILGLDFSKAFNSNSHVSLKKILRYIGFKENTIRIIMLLLAEAQIVLNINGKRSTVFQLGDGTGQGDPISSFLFNLLVQIFIIRIIHDSMVNHFKIDGNDMMLEMFADDIHIFLDGNDDQSLNRVMQITSQFRNLSGLQLSHSKTEVLGINESQNI